MIADVMAIGMINSKTTGARLIPAYGKKVGDWVNLGGLFGDGPVMAVSSGRQRRVPGARGADSRAAAVSDQLAARLNSTTAASPPTGVSPAPLSRRLADQSGTPGSGPLIGAGRPR